jgi:phospho-N-acetylmuramoyl-pentapeptide-transferase
MAAFGLTVLALPHYINWLKKQQIGQFLREEGPASHASKAKTPTAGGACFIVVIASVSLLSILAWATFCLMGSGFRGDALWQIGRYSFPSACLVLLLSASCGFLGYFDDLAKVRKKANDGLSASIRLRLELLFGLIFAVVLLKCFPEESARFLVVTWPFGQSFTLPSLCFVLLSMFMVAATTNAINLHDGMDGLSSGTVFLVLLSLAIMLVMTNHIGLALVACTASGALLAFLFFNIYPAKIFMGDTGSLFLGGLLAGLTIAGGLVLWFVPLSVIYIAETTSVMAQVIYFKLTKPYQPAKPMNTVSLTWLKLTKRLPGEGKRLFRMAPLHHHFESVMAQKGVSEWQVVLGFWLAQLIICISVLICFYINLAKI